MLDGWTVGGIVCVYRVISVQTRAYRSTDKSLLPSSIVFRCTLNNNELHAVASSVGYAIMSSDRI